MRGIMKPLLRILPVQGTMGPLTYLAIIGLLLLFRCATDFMVAAVGNTEWAIRNYLASLVWPAASTFFVSQSLVSGQDFILNLFFLVAVLACTVCRLRDARLPIMFVLLVFAPIVNLLLIGSLCLLGTRKSDGTDAGQAGETGKNAVINGPSVSVLVSLLVSSIVGSLVTVGLVYMAASVFQIYGFGLFFGAPFFLGLVIACLHGITTQRTKVQCVGAALLGVVFCASCLMVFAMEGVICLVMALPVGLPMVLLGAFLGYFIQKQHWSANETPKMLVGLLTMMPCLLAGEGMVLTEPGLRRVQTTIIVNAAPETVWRHVIEFPPLPEPEEWLFRLGFAYPMHATIVGRGVGAERLCVFSTGPFVEPITEWDEPRKLAFTVTSQPEPMRELSPYHIHPPHLDNFLVSKRGQFLLEGLPDGKTRLEGTTWYTNRMWPEIYWGGLADRIIGSIHRRVLEHVRKLAEMDHNTPTTGQADQ